MPSTLASSHPARLLRGLLKDSRHRCVLKGHGFSRDVRAAKSAASATAANCGHRTHFFNSRLVSHLGHSKQRAGSFAFRHGLETVHQLTPGRRTDTEVVGPALPASVCEAEQSSGIRSLQPKNQVGCLPLVTAIADPLGVPWKLIHAELQEGTSA